MLCKCVDQPFFEMSRATAVTIEASAARLSCTLPFHLALRLLVARKLCYGHFWQGLILSYGFKGQRSTHPEMALTPPQHPGVDIVANLAGYGAVGN